jgi:hypothetical protein
METPSGLEPLCPVLQAAAPTPNMMPDNKLEYTDAEVRAPVRVPEASSEGGRMVFVLTLSPQPSYYKPIALVVRLREPRRHLRQARNCVG